MHQPAVLPQRRAVDADGAARLACHQTVGVEVGAETDVRPENLGASRHVDVVPAHRVFQKVVARRETEAFEDADFPEARRVGIALDLHFERVAQRKRHLARLGAARRAVDVAVVVAVFILDHGLRTGVVVLEIVVESEALAAEVGRVREADRRRGHVADGVDLVAEQCADWLEKRVDFGARADAETVVVGAVEARHRVVGHHLTLLGVPMALGLAEVPALGVVERGRKGEVLEHLDVGGYRQRVLDAVFPLRREAVGRKTQVALLAADVVLHVGRVGQVDFLQEIFF